MVKDKVVIITGSGAGIGKDAAIMFAKNGANLVICDINESGINEVKQEVEKYGVKALAVKVDVTDYSSVENMVNKTIEEFGRVDVLINNAGITMDALLIKMSEEQFDKVIAVNLKGVFNCTKAVIKHMMKAKYGRVINTSSVVGVYGNVAQTNYSATKAGVIGMTKTWAKEYGKRGITFNAVAPGFIKTAMTDKLSEKVLNGMKEKCLIPRLGTPEDVANLYMFLASDMASYITGQVIGVDGGLVL